MDDELDLDFDNEMFEDDLFGEEGDPFAPPPKLEGREAVIAQAKDFKKGFLGSFKITPEDMTNLEQSVDKFMPESIQSEYSAVKDIKDVFSDSISELKTNARKEGTKIADIVESLLPPESRFSTILEKTRDFFGLRDDSYGGSTETEEEREDKNIASNIIEALGAQQTQEDYREALQESIRQKAAMTEIELARHNNVYLEELNKFNQEVGNRYYRESLKLQYKHLFISNKMLELQKSGFETFKNLLGGILKNTGLPDIIKTTTGEALKHSILSNGMSALSDKLLKTGDWKKNLKANLKDKTNSILNGISQAVSSAEGMAGMADMAGGEEMAAMGMTKENMAGGEAGSFVRNILMGTLGKKFEKTSIGKKVLGSTKSFMLNPSEYLEELADKKGEDSFFGKLARTGSDLLRVNNEKNEVSELEKKDLKAPALYTNKTDKTINKVIPEILTKIFGEVKAIRTKAEEPEEIKFDYDKDKFVSKQEITSGIQKDIRNNLITSGTIDSINRILDTMERVTKIDLKEDEKIEIGKGLLSYMISGKSLNPIKLEKNGFFDVMPEKVKGKAKELFNKYQTTGKDELENAKRKEILYENLNKTAEQIPSLMANLDNADTKEQTEQLEQLGLVSYDDESKKYKVNNDKYKDLLLKSMEESRNEELLNSVRKIDYKEDKTAKSVKESILATKQKVSDKIKDSKETIKKVTNKVTHTSLHDLKDETELKVKSTISNIKDSKIYKETKNKLSEIKNSEVAKYLEKQLKEAKDSETIKLIERKIEEIKDSETIEKINKEIKKIENSKTVKETKKKIDKVKKDIKKSKLVTETNKEINKIKNNKKINKTINKAKDITTNTLDTIYNSNINDLNTKVTKTINTTKDKVKNYDYKEKKDEIVKKTKSTIKNIKEYDYESFKDKAIKKTEEKYKILKEKITDLTLKDIISESKNLFKDVTENEYLKEVNLIRQKVINSKTSKDFIKNKNEIIKVLKDKANEFKGSSKYRAIEKTIQDIEKIQIVKSVNKKIEDAKNNIEERIENVKKSDEYKNIKNKVKKKKNDTKLLIDKKVTEGKQFLLPDKRKKKKTVEEIEEENKAKNTLQDLNKTTSLAIPKVITDKVKEEAFKHLPKELQSVGNIQEAISKKFDKAIEKSKVSTDKKDNKKTTNVTKKENRFVTMAKETVAVPAGVGKTLGKFASRLAAPVTSKITGKEIEHKGAFKGLAQDTIGGIKNHGGILVNNLKDDISKVKSIFKRKDNVETKNNKVDNKTLPVKTEQSKIDNKITENKTNIVKPDTLKGKVESIKNVISKDNINTSISKPTTNVLANTNITKGNLSLAPVQKTDVSKITNFSVTKPDVKVNKTPAKKDTTKTKILKAGKSIMKFLGSLTADYKDDTEETMQMIEKVDKNVPEDKKNPMLTTIAGLLTKINSSIGSGFHSSNETLKSTLDPNDKKSFLGKVLGGVFNYFKETGKRSAMLGLGITKTLGKFGGRLGATVSNKVLGTNIEHKGAFKGLAEDTVAGFKNHGGEFVKNLKRDIKVVSGVGKLLKRKKSKENDLQTKENTNKVIKEKNNKTEIKKDINKKEKNNKVESNVLTLATNNKQNKEIENKKKEIKQIDNISKPEVKSLPIKTNDKKEVKVQEPVENKKEKTLLPISKVENKPLLLEDKTKKTKSILTKNTSEKSIGKGEDDIKKSIGKKIADDTKEFYSKLIDKAETISLKQMYAVDKVKDKTSEIKDKVANSKVGNKTKEVVDKVKESKVGKKVTEIKDNVKDKTDTAILKALYKKDEVTEKLTETLKSLKDKLGNKDEKKKANPFDRDGDGDRDGNWKERLEAINKKAKSKVKAGIKTVKEKVKKDGWLFSLLSGMAGVFYKVYKSIKTFMPFLKKIAGGIMDVVKGVMNLPGKIGGAIKGAWNAVKNVGSKVVEGAKAVGGKIVDGAKAVGGKLWDGAKAVGGWIKNKITGSGGTKLAEKGAGAVAKATGKKIKSGAVKTFLKKMKTLLIKKLGAKGAGKLMGKIASRFVPFLGTAMLAYDAIKIGWYMLHDGLPFKSAVSKQILGFDLFNNDDVPRDEDGNPIKPEVDPKDVEKEKEKLIKDGDKKKSTDDDKKDKKDVDKTDTEDSDKNKKDSKPTVKNTLDKKKAKPKLNTKELAIKAWLRFKKYNGDPNDDNAIYSYAMHRLYIESIFNLGLDKTAAVKKVQSTDIQAYIDDNDLNREFALIQIAAKKGLIKDAISKDKSLTDLESKANKDDKKKSTITKNTNKKDDKKDVVKKAGTEGMVKRAVDVTKKTDKPGLAGAAGKVVSGKPKLGRKELALKALIAAKKQLGSLDKVGTTNGLYAYAMQRALLDLTINQGMSKKDAVAKIQNMDIQAYMDENHIAEEEGAIQGYVEAKLQKVNNKKNPPAGTPGATPGGTTTTETTDKTNNTITTTDTVVKTTPQVIDKVDKTEDPIAKAHLKHAVKSSQALDGVANNTSKMVDVQTKTLSVLEKIAKALHGGNNTPTNKQASNVGNENKTDTQTQQPQNQNLRHTHSEGLPHPAINLARG